MNEEHDRDPEHDTAPREDAFLPLDRFNAFSDGVFAIAITLLVLELPVPAESEPLISSLRHDWTEFLGYFISFAFVGGVWMSHSELTKFMKRGDPVSYGINLLMLLFVALFPFSTRLLVTHLDGSDEDVATILYGLNVLVASFTLSLLIFYVAREPALLVDDTTEETLKRVLQRRWIGFGLASFGVIVALVAPTVAVGLYLISTMLLLALPLVGLGWHRHKRRRQA